MAIRVFALAMLLLSFPFLQVVRCQSDSEVEVAEVGEEAGDIGIVSDDFQDFGDGSFSPAAGVDTDCVFPTNAARLVPAGKETELLVGVNNEGESSMNIIAIKASLHLPFDHHLLVQNLTTQEFYNASVPFSSQATFPYIFAVNKYLQPGTFDLMGTIIYEISQHPYQSMFYNGTIEVVEASGFLSIESVFLVTLGVALSGLFGMWIYGQIQHLSKVQSDDLFGKLMGKLMLFLLPILRRKMFSPWVPSKLEYSFVSGLYTWGSTCYGKGIYQRGSFGLTSDV